MEAEKTAKKSVAMERQVACYPPPKYHTLFMGYLSLNEMNKSEAATEIIKEFFEKMDPKQKQRCLNEGIRVTTQKGLSKHHY